MLQYIFINIKKGSSLEEYENLFNQTSDQTYKDYLHNEYVTNNKSTRDIGSYLGTTHTVITRHLNKYSIKREANVNDGKVFNKTPSMIEKETGRKLLDIYNELSDKGMSLTEIAAHLKMKHIGTLSQYLFNQRNKQRLEEIGDSNLIIKGLRGKRPETVEKEFINQLGMTYKDFLKQKYIDEGMTIQDMEELIGISARRISDRLKYYELNKSLSQARKDSIKMDE
jgi:hypothetical protein